MASHQTGCGNIQEAAMGSGQLEQSCISFKDSEHSAASSGQHVQPVGTRQRDFLPENHPENPLIVHEALRMNLPLHLVLEHIRRRVQTRGAGYSDAKELVADLFAPGDREVPMETNQLEVALMMSGPEVRAALRMGAPPRLIESKLRDKILSSGVGYAHVSELLEDLNMNS